MSNETQALERIDPAALAALMTPEEIQSFNDDFAAGVASDFLPQVSIRGNKFRVKIGGQETVIGTEIEAILVASRNCLSKTFYLGGYDPKAEQKAPDCSSVDSQYPDSNIKEPQAANCQICDKNAWGSAKGDSKGKACSDYKQLVIAFPAGPQQAFSLRIPPTSFKPFNSYIQKLKMQNVPAIAAITKMVLVGDEYPVLDFAFGGLIDRKSFDTVREVAQSNDVQNLVKIQARAALPAAPTPAPQAAVQPVVVDTPAPVAAPEPQPETTNALQALLAKKTEKPKTTRKKKAEPEVTESAEVAELQTAPNSENSVNSETQSTPITDINALLAKLNKA